MNKRQVLQKAINFLLRRLTRMEFSGLENIPPTGGIIIATNHLSRFDIPLLFVNPVRPDITALVADKYINHWFIGWFTRQTGGIFIDRSKADFTAFRQALEALNAGRALGVSPEGTRSTTASLLEGKSGLILLATRADVPIVPVALTGTENVAQALPRLKRAFISSRFGRAFRLPAFDGENRDAFIQKWTDEVMCRIAALLPEKYRGFYSQHPRLMELLASGEYT